MGNFEMDQMFKALQSARLDPELKEGAEKIASGFMDAVRKYQASLEKVQSDGLLSEKGKQVKHAEINRQFISQIEELGSKNFDRNIQVIEEQLRDAGQSKGKSEIGAVLAHLRQQEIRQHFGLHQKDEIEIMAEIGNPLVEEAVLSSPVPLLSEEKLQGVRMAHARRVRPELAKELEELHQANQIIKRFHLRAKSELKDSGAPEEDPLFKFLGEQGPVEDPLSKHLGGQAGV